jgi:hypothetical protein
MIYSLGAKTLIAATDLAKPLTRTVMFPVLTEVEVRLRSNQVTYLCGVAGEWW